MKTAPSPDGFASTYGVELLCVQRPTIAKRQLLAAMQRHCPTIAPLDGKPDSDILAFVQPNTLVEFKEGSLPAQLFMAVADKRLKVETLEPSLQQSWGFPQAREKVGRCKVTVLVSDLMTSGLEYRSRLSLFQNALAGILAVVPCEAIAWRPSQQIIDPKAFLESLEKQSAPNPLAGAVNVRLFNIDGTDGEMVMDSLGLAALGLCDVQCHFRDLEVNDMATFLFNLAAYLFDNGDVIADGHTVEGIPPGTKWRCQHEKALIAPEREVLDIDPGQPYAAGGRNSS